MKKYKNRNGNSGIKAYEISEDAISIKFTDGSIYLYSYNSSGKVTIEIMKGLAKKGIGLTTYINQQVKDSYEKKIR